MDKVSRAVRSHINVHSVILLAAVSSFAVMMFFTTLRQAVITMRDAQESLTSFYIKTLQPGSQHVPISIGITINIRNKSVDSQTLERVLGSCSCERTILNTPPSACRNISMIIDYGESSESHTHFETANKFLFVLLEGPRDWSNQETLFWSCRTSNVPVVVTFAVKDSPLDETSRRINSYISRKSEEMPAFMMDRSMKVPVTHSWVTTGHFNQVILSPIQYYLEGVYQRTQINSLVSSTPGSDGEETLISFFWKDGEVQYRRQYKPGSYWQLVILACTVLLAFERVFAFGMRIYSSIRSRENAKAEKV